MASVEGRGRARRVILLWLLVAAELGGAAYLGERLWELRVGRLRRTPVEAVRLLREGCAAARGACLMDPLLLAGPAAAPALREQLELAPGSQGALEGDARAAALAWLARPEVRAPSGDAGGDVEATVADVEPACRERTTLAALLGLACDCAWGGDR